jgi:hypothetical protein
MSRNSILNKKMEKNVKKYAPYRTLWLKHKQHEILEGYQLGGESKGEAIVRAVFTATDLTKKLDEYKLPGEEYTVCLMRLIDDFVRFSRMVRQ